MFLVFLLCWIKLMIRMNWKGVNSLVVLVMFEFISDRLIFVNLFVIYIIFSISVITVAMCCEVSEMTMDKKLRKKNTRLKLTVGGFDVFLCFVFIVDFTIGVYYVVCICTCHDNLWLLWMLLYHKLLFLFQHFYQFYLALYWLSWILHRN